MDHCGCTASYSTDKKKLDSVALTVRIRCVCGTRTLRLRYAYVALAVRIRCASGTRAYWHMRFRYAYVAHSLHLRYACVALALRMRCTCDVKFLFVSTVHTDNSHTVHGCHLCTSGTRMIRDQDKSIISFYPGRLTTAPTRLEFV